MPGFFSRGRIVPLAIVAFALLADAPAWAAPAVLCVNFGGTGGCFSAIQDAIDAAGKAGGVITIGAGTYLENLAIPKAKLTLAGNSGDTHIIASNNVAIAAGAQVTISNLDIAEGFNNGGGGCIESAAKLTLQNVALFTCFGSRGGAIHQVGGSLTMIDSTIDGNQASGDGGCLAMEGGKLNLQDVEISNCFAGGDGGAIWLSNTAAIITSPKHDVANIGTGHADGSGGGIFAAGGKLVLDGVFMMSNTAALGDGGAVNSNAPLTIRNSDFIQNSAFGDGGAIFAIPPGKLTVTNSGFLENNSSFSDGGGIAAETAFSFLNLTLVANHAGENGGGILARGNGKIGSLTIDGNTSSGDGGGISIGSGAVKITNTIIGENAASGSGPDCSGSFSSQGFNLISNVSGCSISGQTSTNIVGQNPELGMAEPFDGLTIQEPLMGSPVLGAGGHCPKTDEIMHTRPHTGCDIGALELP